VVSLIFDFTLATPDHLLLDSAPNIGHSYLAGNLTNPKIAETKALETKES
jgi:hypothetical protein